MEGKGSGRFLLKLGSPGYEQMAEGMFQILTKFGPAESLSWRIRMCLGQDDKIVSCQFSAFPLQLLGTLCL
jgi:hypothetical protein